MIFELLFYFIASASTIASILKRSNATDEEDLIKTLALLDSKKSMLKSATDEKHTILDSMNRERSSLVKQVTPVVVAMFMLSKMGVCSPPSFLHFCQAVETQLEDHNEEEEEGEDFRHKVYVRYSYQIKESMKVIKSAKFFEFFEDF